MAITTLDGAHAGMCQPCDFIKAPTGTMVVGRAHSLFYQGGMPIAGVAPTVGIGGEVLTTLVGQLPFTNPVSGNSYLARLQGQVGLSQGTLMLCDRLWQNSGLDVTSVAEQVFAGSSQIPARDRDGANAGVGVYGAVEVSTVTGAGTPILTLKYTDQAGNAGATAVNQVATVAASIAGTLHIIGLAAGDTGIQKAESLTLSETWTSGTIHVVLFRIIARLELNLVHGSNAIDALTGGFQRLYNNSVPFLVFIPGATSSSYISGHAVWAQG